MFYTRIIDIFLTIGKFSKKFNRRPAVRMDSRLIGEAGIFLDLSLLWGWPG